jgi:hypothetical protein
MMSNVKPGKRVIISEFKSVRKNENGQSSCGAGVGAVVVPPPSNFERKDARLESMDIKPTRILRGGLVTTVTKAGEITPDCWRHAGPLARAWTGKQKQKMG